MSLLIEGDIITLSYPNYTRDFHLSEPNSLDEIKNAILCGLVVVSMSSLRIEM